MDTISKERRDAAKTVIGKALQFANWAAGEGLSPAEGEPADDPADFLSAYSDATDDIEWETLHERIPALLDALDAAEAGVRTLGSEPVAWQYRDKRLAAGEWRRASDADLRAVLALHPDIYELRPLYAAPPALAPAIPEGWKLVPVDPTEAMLDAAIDEADWRVKVPGADAEAVSVAEQMNNMAKTAMASTYRAMLASAPEAK